MLIHATAVAVGGRAILFSGASGSGKSDLALRLIDRGALLIADDAIFLTRDGAWLRAANPAPERVGQLMIPQLGLLRVPALAESARIALECALAEQSGPVNTPDVGPERLGLRLPRVHLCGYQSSAPLLVELALLRFGL